MRLEDLKRLARTAETQADALFRAGDVDGAAAAVTRAERLWQAVRAVEEELRGLPGRRDVGTVGTQMETAVARSRGAAISAAKTKNPTLFQQKLQERGLSIPEWAATKKLDEDVVRSWTKRGGVKRGGRAVPALWAKRIAVEFGEPRLTKPEYWPNGIR